MEPVNAIVTTVVVGVVGWLGVSATQGRYDELTESLNERFDAIDKRFDAVDRRFERVETSLDALRSDLTQVALAVGVARRPATNG